MLHLTINDILYDIPDGWNEVKFSEVNKLINGSGDALFDLCGLPTEVALLTSEKVQHKIQIRLDSLKDFPKQVVSPLNISVIPFGKYATIVQAVSPLDKLKVLYPDILDNVEDCLPLYLALNEGMDKFHKQWKTLESEPSFAEKNAGVSRLEPFGIYGLITSLVKGDITKEEELMKLETGHVFLHRSYHKVFAEVHQAFNHNRKS